LAVSVGCGLTLNAADPLEPIIKHIGVGMTIDDARTVIGPQLQGFTSTETKTASDGSAVEVVQYFAPADPNSEDYQAKHSLYVRMHDDNHLSRADLNFLAMQGRVAASDIEMLLAPTFVYNGEVGLIIIADPKTRIVNKIVFDTVAIDALFEATNMTVDEFWQKFAESYATKIGTLPLTREQYVFGGKAPGHTALLDTGVRVTVTSGKGQETRSGQTINVPSEKTIQLELVRKPGSSGGKFD